MNRWLKRSLVCSLLLSCNEYTIQETPEPVTGVSNPAPPDTEIQHDTITQVINPEVDILFVIDDSCSMADEQLKLANSFPEFAKYFIESSLDYHIGVITTDVYNWTKKGKLQYSSQFNPPYKWIDMNTPNPELVFSLNATVGTTGYHYERSMDAIKLALTLEHDNHNAGFFRENAVLHTIIISDEDDVSEIVDVEFYNFLYNLKTKEDMVKVHGIFGLVPYGCGSAYGTAYPGYRYDGLISVFKGEKHSICENEWRSILDKIGLAASGLKTSFFLTAVPNSVTLEVWIEDGDFIYVFEQGQDYLYDPVSNSISFVSYQPPRGVTIHIEYELASSYAGTYSESFEDTGI